MVKGSGDFLIKRVLKIELRNWNAVFDQVSNRCIVREENGSL